MPIFNIAENGYKYYFNDADGTKHWLKKETENNKTIYKDEDGLGYTLTEISKGSISTAPDAVFEMVDKDENKMYFDWWGNLVQLKNPTGVTSSLTYTDAGGDRRLETITDGAGRIYTFSYASSESRQVSKITDPAGRETTFTYDSSSPKKLTAIHFADGEKVELFYNSSALLSEIRGIDGTRTKISYDGSEQKRVTQINWGASDSNLLEKYTFAYKQNSTTVTDVLLDRSYTYQFNDFGQNTGIVSNTDGSAQFYKWAQPESVTDSRANKLMQESQILQTVTNYVVNPGFTRAYSDGYGNYIENTANQSISIDASRKNITNSALKVYKAASNTGRVNAVQYVNGLSAGTYTFSAYVNTENVTLTDKAWVLAEVWTANGGYVSSNFAESTACTDGWERKSVTFDVPAGCQVRLIVGFGAGGSGTVWFDDLQLEKGEGESTFNLVENSGFTNGMTGWGSEGGEAGWTANCSLSGFSRCGQLPGTVEGRYKSLLQTIYVSGKKGDVFSFGMWAYASSAPIENGTKDGDPYQPDFEIVLHYYDASGRWKGYIHLNCNPDLKNAWQFVTEEAIIPEDYGKIAISLLYDHNVNAAYMTGAFCYKEQYGQTYDYDKDGNVVSTKDLAETNSKFTYCTNQMSSMLNPSGSSYLYAYNDKKQLTYALSSDGQQYGFTYDGNGNVTKAEITPRAPATTIESGKEYYLINAYSGLALDSYWAGNAGDNSSTFRYVPGATEQIWKLEAVAGEENVFRLKTMVAPQKDLYFDVENGSSASGTLMQIANSNGSSAQKFKIVKERDNTFSLFTGCSNYTLLVDGQKHGNYVELSRGVYQTTPYPNADEPCYGQRWYFYPVEATEDKTIVTETTYTANGNFAATSKDQRGNTTAYQYNETKGTLTKTTDALGRETGYTYYPNDNKLETVSSGGMTNTYTYENDRLQTINVNGALQYRFNYDAFGRKTSTEVVNGSTWRTLSNIEYAPNGQIAKQTYGNPDNGDYIENSYDDLDRLTQICYNGSSTNRAVYKYGTNGKLSQTIDFAANTRTKFVYDLANRVVSEREYTGTGVNGGTLRSFTDFTYADKTNYLTGVKHFSPLGTQNIGYTYGDISLGQMPDQIYKVSWNGQDKINYTYDGLGRLTNKSVILSASEESQPPRLNNQYTYIDVGTDKTTTLVQSVQTAAGTYTYTYDAVGNILSASDGTYTNSYVYDSLNQLVRENNQRFGKTYTYAYTNGNITERKEYAYTTGELGTPQYVYNWSYGDGTWSDLLTAWNEGTESSANASSASAFSLQNTAESDETAQSFFKRALQRSSANSHASRAARTASTTDTTPSFSYDEIGNPTEIFGLQFSWNGRTLTSVTVPDDPYVSRVDYGYNMDGQRISKTLTAPDGTVTTTEYFYNGENLAGEKTGDRTVVYMYDNNGDIFGFTVNGRTYYYVKNAQNDVTAITDSNGTVVVYYYYDAWGDPNYTHYACTGQTLDDVRDNPILYRSYYYDIDVGFYYLNSRYYVPMFCRFLNADDTDVLDEDQDSMLEENLFTYCLNNPVNMADDDGTVAWWIAAAAAGAAWDAAFYCVEAAITGNFSWKGLGKAALKGAVTGLAFGAVGKIAGKAYKAVKVARSVKHSSKVSKALKTGSKLKTVAQTISKSSAKVKNLIKSADKFKYSRTALKHMRSRPYMNSTLTIREIMRAANPTIDTSLKNGLKWVVNGSYKGTPGVWELVVDCSSKTIVHFLFKS